MKHDIKRLLLASTLLMGLQSQAHAQETASTPAPADPAGEDGAIIVTGSRLTTNLEQAAPIVSVSQADLALSGQVNIENVLKELPQLLPGTTAASNNPGDATATANLRGLGSARTLVLVNGRRYISYDVNQIVDLNSIPTALIERVDVVTGGKSAVYGSDAVTGVVNFVTKQDFEGVQANANYRITGKGDGGTFNGGLLAGKNFAEGRGNVTLYGEYLDRKAIKQADRSYTSTASDGGATEIPEGLLVTVDGQNAVVFNEDGSYRPYMGDSYNYAPENYMQVPQKRILLSAQAHYDVNDSLTLYAEGQYVHNRIKQQLAPTGLSGGFLVDIDSSFLASDTQALLSSYDIGNGYAPAYIYRRLTELGNRYAITTANAYRGVLGGRGTISGDWDFDLYGSYAETRRVKRQYGGVSSSRVQQALLTTYDGSGNLVCADASNGCVPLNLFGEGNISDAAADFISIDTVTRYKVTELVASGAVTNKRLFDLGAGPAGVAFGAEYRREHGSSTPDEALSSGDVIGWPSSQPTSGGYNVKELFAEIEVPILADRPFVDRLTFNGAARYSNYSTAVNSVGTFSAGLVYAPVRDFSLRGQFSRAVRAPTINELYYGESQSYGYVTDPSLGASYPTYTTTGGNANLREETATTYTFGAVVQPQAVPGLSASVDYYHIKIDDFITTPGSSNILAACYGTADNGYTPYDTSYCSLIERNSGDGSITNIQDNLANSGGVKTDGIDFEVRYGFPISLGKDDSRLDLQLGGTRLLNWKYQPIASVSDLVVDCAGRFGLRCSNVYAKWRLNGRVSWSSKASTVSLAWRHLSPVHDDDNSTDYEVERIKAYDYFDVATAFRVADRFTWTLGMNNMFDKKPPIVGTNQDQANTYPSTYDVYGRTFFTSLVVSL